MGNAGPSTRGRVEESGMRGEEIFQGVGSTQGNILSTSIPIGGFLGGSLNIHCAFASRLESKTQNIQLGP